eukprot:scpid75630/ scgid31664/ Intraflagellar transport protein 27 homolog; Putative GTP-binding protein RAY-like; Rab-like protein 4
MSQRMLSLKTLVVGSSKVGKTALVKMFCSDGTDFPKQYLLTHEYDLESKMMALQDNKGYVSFLLFDCSGREVYEEFVVQTWKDACGVIVVYDVTDRESFEDTVRWGNQLRTKLGRKASNIPAVLVGNKRDLEERRVVSTEEGAARAKLMSCAFLECSSKNFEDVIEPFRLLALEATRLYDERIGALDVMAANMTWEDNENDKDT